MVRSAVVVALALQACGPRSPGPEQPDASTPGQPDASTSGTPDASDSEREDKPRRADKRGASQSKSADPGPGCPERFDASMQDSTCAQGSHCVYPEAECWCQGKQVCSGVDPGPDAQVWFEWSCRVSDPAVRRADGCPARVPEQGERCEKNGQVCRYSPYCGGTQSTGRCTNNAWQVEQIAVSAPPSAEG